MVAPLLGDMFDALFRTVRLMGWCLVTPRSWPLWRKRPAYVAYLLSIDTLGIGAAVLAVATSPEIRPLDGERLAILLLCTAFYFAWSHRHEQARRSLKNLWAHVDLAGMWSVATALVLPPPLVLVIIAMTRLARWPAADKAPHRFAFTTASIVFAAIMVGWLARSLGITVRSTSGLLDSAPLLAGLLGTSLLYATIQAVVVAGASLLEGTVPVDQVLGTWRENAVAAAGSVLGVLAAITLVANPVAVLIIVCIGAAATKAVALAEDATYDLRTGLLNPTAWQQQADRAVAQAQRNGRACSVLFVDADHFKLINDSYGHPVGDRVLHEFGALLRGMVRRGDVAGRYGGEELVVLLPDTDLDQAKVLAERIRSAAALLEVPAHTTRGEPVTLLGRDAPIPVDRTGTPRVDATGQLSNAECHKISVSIGVASASGQQLNLTALTVAADRAVLDAKAAGRNQVRSQGDRTDQACAA